MSLRLISTLAVVLLSVAACASNQPPEVATVSLADQVAAVQLASVPPPLSITPTYWPDNQASAPAPVVVYRAQQ